MADALNASCLPQASGRAPPRPVEPAPDSIRGPRSHRRRTPCPRIHPRAGRQVVGVSLEDLSVTDAAGEYARDVAVLREYEARRVVSSLEAWGGNQGDGDDFGIVKMAREGAFVMLDGFDQVVSQAEGGYNFFVPRLLPPYGLVFGLSVVERRSSWRSIGGNLG